MNQKLIVKTKTNQNILKFRNGRGHFNNGHPTERKTFIFKNKVRNKTNETEGKYVTKFKFL